MPTSPNRLYTDKEISAILARAGELQRDQGSEQATGLSLQELQQIAADVGLDPSLVQMAAAELEGVGTEAAASPWLGGPLSLQIERILPGEVQTSQWADITHAISQAFGVVGTSAQVGQTLEWTHHSRRKQLQVTLTPVEGQTRVRIQGQFKRVAVLFFLPWTVLALIYGFLLPIALGVPALGSAFIGLFAMAMVFMAARFGYGKYARRHERSAAQVLQRLSTLIEAPTPVQAAPERSPSLTLPEAEGRSSAATEPPQHLRSRS